MCNIISICIVFITIIILTCIIIYVVKCIKQENHETCKWNMLVSGCCPKCHHAVESKEYGAYCSHCGTKWEMRFEY